MIEGAGEYYEVNQWDGDKDRLFFWALKWKSICIESETEDSLDHPLITSDRLEIQVENRDGGSLLRLRGRLNIDSSPQFRDRLLATLRAESQKLVVVDFADVVYIDSSGLATLIEGLKVAHNRQSKLCVQALQGRLLHLFEVTGVLSLFEAIGCRETSLASRRS